MKKAQIQCFLSLLLILLIGGMLVTHAWFYSGWNSGLSLFDFSAGVVPPPTATVWIYSTELENEGAKAEWVSHPIGGDTENPYDFLMPSLNVEKDETTYSFETKSLHFGTLDNLVVMNFDNMIYFRFDFHSEVHGNSAARVEADLSGQMLHLYDLDGQDRTELLKNDLLGIHNTTSFLQYQGCVSSKALTPDSDGFDELPLSEKTMLGETLDLYANGQQQIEGAYYIYIKIAPNLSAFAPASELLNPYMPCVISFDTQLQLTVY